MKFIKRTYSLEPNHGRRIDWIHDDRLPYCHPSENYEALIANCDKIWDEEVEDLEIFDEVDYQGKHTCYVTRYHAINEDEEIIASSVPPIEYNTERELVIKNFDIFVKAKNVELEEIYDNPNCEEIEQITYRGDLEIFQENVDEAVEFYETKDLDEITEGIWGDIQSEINFTFTDNEEKQITDFLAFQIDGYLSKM